MSKVVIKLDSDGIQALLKSSEVEDELENIGNSVMSRLSGNYTMDTQKGKYRSQTRIKTSDNSTFYRNLHNNEMLKALHK